VRSQDRKVNTHRYPELNYPEVYILDGGYSRFFHTNSARCEPQNYLRMDAKEHEQSCERGLNKLRANFRNRPTLLPNGGQPNGSRQVKEWRQHFHAWRRLTERTNWRFASYGLLLSPRGADDFYTIP
jgi:hypothetical protein